MLECCLFALIVLSVVLFKFEKLSGYKVLLLWVLLGVVGIIVSSIVLVKVLFAVWLIFPIVVITIGGTIELFVYQYNRGY